MIYNVSLAIKNINIFPKFFQLNFTILLYEGALFLIDQSISFLLHR